MGSSGAATLCLSSLNGNLIWSGDKFLRIERLSCVNVRFEEEAVAQSLRAREQGAPRLASLLCVDEVREEKVREYVLEEFIGGKHCSRRAVDLVGVDV